MKSYDEIKKMKIRALKKYAKEKQLDINLSDYSSKNYSDLQNIIITMQGIDKNVEQLNVMEVNNEKNIKIYGAVKPINKWKMNDLKQYCKDSNYKGYSKYKKKDELIDFIIEMENKFQKEEEIDDDDDDIKAFPDEKDWPKKLKELKELLKKYGVKTGIPTKKNEVKEMLKRERCDPMQNKFCSKEDEKCDMRNHICMPPEFSHRQLELFEYGGKKILGLPKDIKKLKEKIKLQDISKRENQLEKKENIDIEEEDDEMNDLIYGLEDMKIKNDAGKENIDIEEEDDEDEIIQLDILDKKEDIDVLADVLGNMKINEGLNQIKIEEDDKIKNIEDVLNQIQIEEDEDINSINKIQDELYKCLGLL